MPIVTVEQSEIEFSKLSTAANLEVGDFIRNIDSEMSMPKLESSSIGAVFLADELKTAEVAVTFSELDSGAVLSVTVENSADISTEFGRLTTSGSFSKSLVNDLELSVTLRRLTSYSTGSVVELTEHDLVGDVRFGNLGTDWDVDRDTTIEASSSVSFNRLRTLVRLDAEERILDRDFTYPITDGGFRYLHLVPPNPNKEAVVTVTFRSLATRAGIATRPPILSRIAVGFNKLNTRLRYNKVVTTNMIYGFRPLVPRIDGTTIFVGQRHIESRVSLKKLETLSYGSVEDIIIVDPEECFTYTSPLITKDIIQVGEYGFKIKFNLNQDIRSAISSVEITSPTGVTTTHSVQIGNVNVRTACSGLFNKYEYVVYTAEQGVFNAKGTWSLKVISTTPSATLETIPVKIRVK